MSAIDDHLDGLPPAQKAVLERVRVVIRDAAPGVEEGISYGVPAFLFGGRPLVGIRAAKHHLSLFPFSAAVVEAVKDELEGFELSKGTIRFSAERPLPEDVLTKVVELRLQELAPPG